METYLPFIKALLSEWYLFTLNNPLYAATLASAVWLLTAMLYSFRIAAIKRGKAASEKAAIKNLNTAQQQLRNTQEELAATLEQMEKAQSTAQDEAQRALSLEQLIYQRNQQIAGIIQLLATNFDLGERPLLATEDVRADSLWQQHDKVITQLIERLRAEQQAKIELQRTFQVETAKLAEKESLLESLQATFATYSNQLSRLELALNEQKTILQQQNDAQQALSASLKAASLPAVPHPVEPEPEPFIAVRTWQQPLPQEESPTIEEPVLAQIEENFKVEPIIEEQSTATRWQNQVEPIVEQPQVASRWQDEQQTATTIEPIFEAATPDLPPQQPEQPLTQETTPESSDSEPRPVPVPTQGSLGKIKSLFGKPKQQPANPEKKSIGKIKNLFSKSKK